jgi:hypothetical protein
MENWEVLHQLLQPMEAPIPVEVVVGVFPTLDQECQVVPA